MRILIVGGAGFLGTNLAHATARDAANSITVVDSLDPRLRSTQANLASLGDRIRFVRGDMRDTPLMCQLVEQQDLIVNCAGQTSHPLSMKDPIFDAEQNTIGHLSLLEAVRMANREAVVVYTSSSTVVGKAITVPIDERHPESPLDIYSANKLVAEKYYSIYHRAHGLRTIIVRFANLYGPFGKGFPEFGFVNYFIHLAATNSTIQIFGEGLQTRNLTYVADACDAILRAAATPALYGTPVFAAHEEHVAVREIAQRIVASFQRGAISHVPWPEDRRRIEVDDVLISSNVLRTATGWLPHYSLEEGLNQTRIALRQSGVPE